MPVMESTDPIVSGSRRMLQEEERGHRLAQFSLRMAHVGPEWYAALENSTPREIIAAIGQMSSIDVNAPKVVACRDAARAMVEQKLTDRMLEQMGRLERPTARLERVGVLVGIAGLALAAAQLVGV